MRNSSEAYSHRMGEARRKAAQEAADFFATSGVKYTCAKVVHDTIRPKLEAMALQPEYQPYNILGQTTKRIAADIVHRRWLNSSELSK